MARTKGSTTAGANMTQISISLPQSLVEDIDEMAKRDNRNRSNYIANTLKNIANDYNILRGKDSLQLEKKDKKPS